MIAAAEATGDRETAAVCEQILRDEERMADWLRTQIPLVTRQYLAQQEGAAGGGLLEGAKQTARNVGERVRDAAPDAGDTRNALLVSGALLAGAGAALLVGKALLGGSEGRQGERREEPGDPEQAPAPDVPADPQPGLAAGAPSEMPLSIGETATDEVTLDGVTLDGVVSDVPAEPVVLSEALADLDDTDLNAMDQNVMDQNVVDQDDTGDAGVAVSQADLVAETVGGDAAYLVASEEPSAEVQATSVEMTSVEMTSGQAEAAAPELHDGSQAAVTSAGADSAAAGTEGTELWRVPGPFSGLGPQGQNGATGPLGEVYERLTQHGHVDATHVEVAFGGDRVRLGGSVDSESTKRLALAAVRGVPGVTGVEDALEVRITDGV